MQTQARNHSPNTKVLPPLLSTTENDKTASNPCVEVIVVHTKDTIVRDAVAANETSGARSKRPSIAAGGSVPEPNFSASKNSSTATGSPTSPTSTHPIMHGSASTASPPNRSLTTVPLQQLMRKALGSLQADVAAKKLYYLPEGNLVVRHTIGIDGYQTNNNQTCVENLYSQQIAQKVRAMFENQKSKQSSGYSPAKLLRDSKTRENESHLAAAPASHTPNSYMYLKPPKNHSPTSSVGTSDAVVVLGGHNGRRRRNLLFGTTLAEPRPILGPMDIPGINVPPRHTWGILLRAIDDILKGVEEKRFIKDGVLLNGYTVTIQAFKLQGTSIIESLVPVNGIVMSHSASPLTSQEDTGSETIPVAIKPATQRKGTIFDGASAEVESRRTSRVSITSTTEAPQNGFAQSPTGTSTRHPSSHEIPGANSSFTPNTMRGTITSPSTTPLPRASSKALDAATTVNLRNQYTRLLSIANGAILEAEENSESNPRRFEVPDGIQLDVKTMSDAVHITNCLEGMYTVSNEQSPTRALPFHMLITIKLTGIVKEKMQAKTTIDFDDVVQKKNSEQNKKDSSPSTLAELYAPLLEKHDSERSVFGGPPKVDATKATQSEINAMLRKSIDRKSSIYQKTANEVQLADDPGMTPLPTRYFHLVELGDLDWTPPEGAQHLPSDALAFQEELSHFATMLKRLQDLEEVKVQLTKAEGFHGQDKDALGENISEDMFSSALNVNSNSNTLQPSPSVVMEGGQGLANMDHESSPPLMRRAQTAYSFNSASNNNNNSDTFGSNNNSNRLQTIMSDSPSEMPGRRFAKALSHQLVEFSHSLRANNLSRLLFSNIDPANVSVVFLANATFAKARTLMTYIAIIRNEPIQIALEGPNGVGRENIDDELRQRIFTSQAEAVAQWATGDQLKAKMKDLTATLTERNEKFDHLEQRLNTLQRLATSINNNNYPVTTGSGLLSTGATKNNRTHSGSSLTPSSSAPSVVVVPPSNNRKMSVTSTSTTQSGVTGYSNISYTDQGYNNSGSASRDRTPPNKHGKEFGESQPERDMRHLRLRCQVLKQKFDESTSDLRKAKIEGSQAIQQLKEAVVHYQEAILNNEKELEVLGDAIQHVDNVLYHKQEAANVVLQKEITATMMYYRKTRQLEEELLQVARERRFIHNELNRLKSEQQRFYSGENSAPTESELKEDIDEKNEKKLKKGDSKPPLSKRRVEALAISNQIKDFEDQLVDLRQRQSDLENTTYVESDFLERDDPSFKELYGDETAGNTTLSKIETNSAIPKSDAETKREKISKLCQSALSTISSHTPASYSVTYHTEKAAKEIARETATIQRHLVANEEAAAKITKALNVETEDLNREAFDAMTEIKTLLTFLRGFESIDNSEAKEFFRGVCPRTDCYKDGIFVNSILSADDLWIFPEQYTSLSQRLAKLGLESEGSATSSPPDGKFHIGSDTAPLSLTSQHAIDEQKKRLQRVHNDLIQTSVKTHLNRVVLDRCEAWSRFFKLDWYPRVNPAVALTSVSIPSARNNSTTTTTVTTVAKAKPAAALVFDSKNAKQFLSGHDTRRESISSVTHIGSSRPENRPKEFPSISSGGSTAFQEFLAAEGQRNRELGSLKGLQVQSDAKATSKSQKASETQRPQSATGLKLLAPKKIQTKSSDTKVKRFN